MEGYLESCLGSSCPSSCCARGFGEPEKAFFLSPRAGLRAEIESLGITLTRRGGIVWYEGCSDGKNCKLLEHFTGDIRPVECKIFPYKHTLIERGGKIASIGIYLNPCPATEPGYSVPDSFTEEALKLIARHYNLLSGDDPKLRDLELRVVDKPQEC